MNQRHEEIVDLILAMMAAAKLQPGEQEPLHDMWPHLAGTPGAGTWITAAIDWGLEEARYLTFTASGKGDMGGRRIDAGRLRALAHAVNAVCRR